MPCAVPRSNLAWTRQVVHTNNLPPSATEAEVRRGVVVVRAGEWRRIGRDKSASESWRFFSNKKPTKPRGLS